MTILTATEDGTVNPSAGNVYFHILHIGLLVKEDTRITHTCTEKIAGDRMLDNLP